MDKKTLKLRLRGLEIDNFFKNQENTQDKGPQLIYYIISFIFSHEQHAVVVVIVALCPPK